MVSLEHLTEGVQDIVWQGVGGPDRTEAGRPDRRLLLFFLSSSSFFFFLPSGLFNVNILD